MAKKGHRKPLAEVVKIGRGTQRPDRRTVPAVPPLTGGQARKPKWLKADAAKIWDTKVAIYLERQQVIRGCEAALAQYCALEACLIAQWRKGLKPVSADLAQYRIYANEFWDTPASQTTTGPKWGTGPTANPEIKNPFARNGRVAGERA